MFQSFFRRYPPARFYLEHFLKQVSGTFIYVRSQLIERKAWPHRELVVVVCEKGALAYCRVVQQVHCGSAEGLEYAIEDWNMGIFKERLVSNQEIEEDATNWPDIRTESMERLTKDQLRGQVRGVLHVLRVVFKQITGKVKALSMLETMKLKEALGI